MVNDDLILETIEQYPGKRLDDLRELMDVCAPVRVVEDALKRLSSSRRIYYKRGVGWYAADESSE